MEPPWKTVWRFLKKLKIELAYNLAFLLLVLYPRKTKPLIQKYTYRALSIAALFTKILKQPMCLSLDE